MHGAGATVWGFSVTGRWMRAMPVGHPDLTSGQINEIGHNALNLFPRAARRIMDGNGDMD